MKSDEKVRMSYMLLQEAYAIQRQSGIYKDKIRLIRRKIRQMSIPDMVDMFEVSADNCKSVVDTINTHPDWDDEQIAEEIFWED